MTDSTLLGIRIPVLHRFLERCSGILQSLFFSAALCWRGCVALPFSLKYHKGALLDSSQGNTWPGHSFNCFFFTAHLDFLLLITSFTAIKIYLHLNSQPDVYGFLFTAWLHPIFPMSFGYILVYYKLYNTLLFCL